MSAGTAARPVPRQLRPVPRAGRRYAFESTVEHLATAIRVGEFAPGEMLPAERELANSLGVSRSTLREALDALRAAGLVATTRGRAGGTAVVGVAPRPVPDGENHGLTDLLLFRQIVEPAAAGLAASATAAAGPSEEVRARLSRLLEEACHPADDDARRRADRALHVAVAELSGSELLLDAVTRVQDHLHRWLREIPVLRVNLQHSETQHRHLVEALLRGDAERARVVMTEHCDATSALLRGLLA